MILTPKTNLGGHPFILGRSWLSTANTFISCKFGDMFISNGNTTKKFTLYPPTREIIEIENVEWIEVDDE